MMHCKSLWIKVSVKCIHVMFIIYIYISMSIMSGLFYLQL